MRAIYLVTAALLLCACGRNPEPAATSNTPAPESAPAPATPSPTEPVSVQLQPTAGNKTSGSLMAFAEGSGVRITGTITGLTPGTVHGFHIHEKGDCSAPDASSAGDHFNPLGHQHGAPDTNSHVGDLGNITADSQGSSTVNVAAAKATLGTGDTTDIKGRAIIVHAKADDLSSQPSGEAGDRIACGVIGGSASSSASPHE